MHAPPLRYPFEQPPHSGYSQDIFDGLTWVRQPLPMALDHINVWLLHSQNECVIVDTGIKSRRSQETWKSILEPISSQKTLSKVIATHLHPDHCGLAGWLCETYDCPLYMTRTEYLLCRALCADSAQDVPDLALDFYRAAGMTEQQLDLYTKAYGGFGKAVSPLPPSYHRLQDGDVLELCGESWTVIVGDGHSPEHACLYNEERKTLISGDQILPRISSIISVWPTEPNANPLADWLSSCRRLRNRIPEDTLILPSHGLPFYGAHPRLTNLIEHHESILEQLIERCRTPQRTVDVFDVLFNSAINDGNLVMAIGEAIAHFNYLHHVGRLTRSKDERGIDWYVSL